MGRLSDSRSSLVARVVGTGLCLLTPHLDKPTTLLPQNHAMMSITAVVCTFVKGSTVVNVSRRFITVLFVISEYLLHETCPSSSFITALGPNPTIPGQFIRRRRPFSQTTQSICNLQSQTNCNASLKSTRYSTLDFQSPCRVHPCPSYPVSPALSSTSSRLALS